MKAREYWRVWSLEVNCAINKFVRFLTMMTGHKHYLKNCVLVQVES